MTGPVAIALPTLQLSRDEESAIADMTARLGTYQALNQDKTLYYEGKKKREDLRIAIPPTLQGIHSVLGWPAAAVDCIDERLDFEGWDVDSDTDEFDLETVYLENDLDVESQTANLDALLYGTAFAAVSTGQAGTADPDLMVTVESPMNMTVIRDARTRRVARGFCQYVDDSDPRYANSDTHALPSGGALFLPNETLHLGCKDGRWTLEHRDQHMLGHVAIAQLVNKPRSSDRGGRSEITQVVRSLTQNGMRTMIAAEVAREYLVAPLRAVLGAKEDMFFGADGKPLPAWKSYMGRLMALERDEYGDLPDIKQFPGASLDSYFGLMRTLTQILSSEIAVPPAYLGFETDNPTSADAIRSMEARLVKRAERRQRGFGKAWTEVARLAIMVREGTNKLPDGAMKIRPKWRDASTPTDAAVADSTTKLVGQKVLPAQSRVTWDRLRISRADQVQIAKDLRKEANQAVVAGLRGSADAARGDATVTDLSERRTADGGNASQ
ncbi:phage portal protein [Mycolicibacterium fortuitum]|uniref:phage portal protein n=1 Tax=Mycolicibacterium fortuitum TaxID=1766 RepID=UPI002620FD27|nr:phage portal protein [Mycolicibacterium fortuitum]